MLRDARVGVVVLASLIGLILLLGSSASFQKCEHEHKNHQAYSALHDESSLFVKGIVRLELHAACARLTSSENDGAIAALSGVAVAIFTFTLWITTDRLWIAARNQSADTKEVIRISQESADAAKLSAAAAIESVAVARDSAIATQRAYLSISYLQLLSHPDPTTGEIDGWGVMPVWLNTGATPARRIIGTTSYYVEAADMPANFEFPVKSGEVPIWPDIGSKEQRPTESTPFPIWFWREVHERKRNFYCWGYVEYSDIFPNTPRRRTEFCVQVILGSNLLSRECQALFTPRSKHNGSDERCMHQPQPFP